MTIYRRCPFCFDNKFDVKSSGDIYFLSCINPNVSAGMYVELNQYNRYEQVATQIPKRRQDMSSYDRQQFNKLQTPFWKLMGQKAKPKDIAYEKELKYRGMTYGDAVLERDFLHATNESPINQLMSETGNKPVEYYKK